MHGRTQLAALPAGTRVVVRMPNGAELAEVLRTCFDLELVAVPLGPRTTGAQLADIVDRVRAASIVDGLGGEVRGTRHPAAADGTEGLAFIMFTSGSTGPQKGVMLSRDAVLGNAAKTAALHGLTPDRPHGTCLPLYHCNALVMSLLGTHRTGAPLVVQAKFDPDGYFSALRAAGARTASIVPALLADLVEAAPAWPDSLDYLITAAAPLTSDLARRFHRRYGPRLRQGYGLTEAVNFSFTMPELTGPAYTEQYVDRFPPVGLPLPGTEFRLAAGEVQVRTADVMTGYWADPAATAETVTPDGWLRTGDLGELRDGLLVLKGRTKERINRGGEKYYPLDLEQRWRAAGLPGRFAAVGVAEPTLGDEIGLVTTDQSVAEVRAVYETSGTRPAVVQFGGFLATSTGKPQRKAMGRLLAVRRQPATRYEGLLRYAAETARTLVRGKHQPAGPMAAMAHALAGTVDGRGHIGDEKIFEAFDFLRTQWTEDDDAIAERKAQWQAQLRTCWPLSEYTELAAEITGTPDVPFGRESALGDGRLSVFPHAVPVTATDGTPWALDLLWTFLDGGEPAPHPDRWAQVRRWRGNGAAVAGFSVLRAGRHDLGGVLWARTEDEE
ncbi:class I adenylate-forming enzyme family protein [Amycolatopsis sp.]|uniref:class I adenylate-forming enzyme family protein n=1 Tax=Amycolatopsis sp. TaxID=37632 RepID=UPI002D7E47D2|nr:class I adenylate-forming enzyme family protein [Amycolatopsis sp.]HET6706377.1 class I adenylate-forming enzyme family protein [Amycolatopsis sp.]